MKTCVQCSHFIPLGEGKNGKGETVHVGHCFRYPPSIAVTGGSAYPVVGALERQCGEFSTIPTKGAAAKKT